MKEWATICEKCSVDSDYIRDSAVSKANNLRPGQTTNRGSITGKYKIIILFQSVQTDFGNYRAAYLMATGSLFQGKSDGGVTYSPPSGGDVKNEWS
jgi:hypothetical protein